LHPKRRSLLRVVARGWFAGPLLFMALISPAIEARTEQSLVVHHLAHWLMVVAGALFGYRLRELVRLPGATLVAWAGLGAALMWHLPPLLSWAEADRTAHMLAHATLVIGGGGLGWAVPKLSSPGKAYLFITANVVMWPLVLAELAGAFDYAGYPGQASAAGVAELAAMSSSWLVLAIWGPIRTLFSSPVASLMVQVLVAVVVILVWVVPL
jgi:hypothetical protein